MFDDSNPVRERSNVSLTSNCIQVESTIKPLYDSLLLPVFALNTHVLFNQIYFFYFCPLLPSRFVESTQRICL